MGFLGSGLRKSRGKSSSTSSEVRSRPPQWPISITDLVCRSARSINVCFTVIASFSCVALVRDGCLPHTYPKYFPPLSA